MSKMEKIAKTGKIRGCQPPEGEEGVSQMLMIANEGGRGGEPNADDC